jgi:coenzyme F420 hydrogenase subunit beta
MRQQKMLSLGIREVISEGFCIGCGTCTLKSDMAKISFNRSGELVADIQACSDAEVASMEVVCPFAAAAPNETVLAKVAFQHEENAKLGQEIGVFTGLYAGYSNTYRKWGSSGGIVGWLLSKLLISGRVDKVIVVGKSDDGQRFFDFKIVDNAEELKATGTSFYYPVSYDKALQYIIDNPGRYAITGVPCFHKALRQLKAVNPLIAERVVYQVGIVCGQMKSAFYLDYLSRKTGADSPPVTACFRRKDETARADDYLFEGSFRTAVGELETRSVRNREIGANWAMGLFKPRACDFCDDVFAETADIAVMDAWLDQYVHDGKGTSLVVTRSEELQALLEKGKVAGELELAAVSENDVVESQRGGLNHRRVGLRYRLFLDGRKSLVPVKRVKPSNRIDVWFRLEQRIRSAIREKSRLAMRKQLDSGLSGLRVYESEMKRVLGLFKWFGRVRSRITGRRDYKSQFKLDI